MVGEPIRERIRSFDPREVVGLLLVVLLVVGGAGFWYVRSLPRSVSVEALGPAEVPGVPPAAAPAAHGAEASPSGPILVHVAGLVRRPGVYELRAGDRIVDAIERAGGPRKRADLTTLNLAAPLVDGQQIVLGREGDQLSMPSAAGTGAPPAPGQEAPGPDDLVNVNTATLEQLETLPGIGPTLGQRIIDHREQHGPFASVDDLMNVSGIGEKRLADLRARATV